MHKHLLIILAMMLMAPDALAQDGRAIEAVNKAIERMMIDPNRCKDKIPIDSSPQYQDIKKWPPNCPQSDVVDPGVANIEINGVKLDIPREYLVRKPLSDGPEAAVQLRFVYPDMTPFEGSEEDKGNLIRLLLSNSQIRDGSATVCHPDYSKWCYPRERVFYQVSSTFSAIENEDQFMDALPASEDIKHDKANQLYYFLPKNNPLENVIYFKGLVANPNFYLVCYKNSSCATNKYFENYLLKMEYRFPKNTLLSHYEDIHEKTINTINSLIVK